MSAACRRAGAHAARLALTVTLAMLGACGGSAGVPWRTGARAARLEGQASLSLLPGPVPLVRVPIGALEALAIVDTGSDVTLVDPAFARRAGLAPLRLAAPVGLARGGRTVHRFEEAVELERLELGALVVEGLLAPLFDMTQLAEGIKEVEHLDALIGMDLLQGHALLLDGPRAELEVVAHEDLLGALGRRYARGSRFERFPLSAQSRLPRLELELADATVPALIDTGASGTSLTPSVLAALGGEPLGEAEERSVAGLAREAYWHLDALSLGSLEFRDFNVGVHEDEALLGWSLFATCVLVVDLAGRELWLALRPEPR